MSTGLGVGEWIVAAACGGVLQGLCHTPTACRCACHFEQSTDSSILEVLREQLQRCGPEHLTRAAAPKCPAVSCPDATLTIVAVALTVGLVSFGIGLVVGRALASRSPSSTVSSSAAAGLPRGVRPGGKGLIVDAPRY